MGELVASGRDAEERWEDAPLTHLSERGAGCGLTEFIARTRSDLVSIVSGARES